MSSNRKICVVTGTRAEYGLLAPLMTLLKQDSEIDFQLVVTGAHLSAQHGSTIKFIEQDGFIADALVDIELADDSVLETAHALAGALEIGNELGKEATILINLSGRGDKDVQTAAEYFGLPS